jgi:TrmH family RNA methyltransferase
MLSKGLIKLINSLNLKKYRQKHGLFVAEGQKMVSDLLKTNAVIKTIITTQSDFSNNKVEVIFCKASELDKISFLKTSQEIIALVKIPQNAFAESEIVNDLSIALDGVQDPGNMGTIIRLANWFGIKHILCSNDCVDIYNPKVVQATMGALFGVKVHYLDLVERLSTLSKLSEYQIYGTFMEGQNIYTKELSSKGIIVMGNEGNGISAEVEELITEKLAIPSFSNVGSGAESLNVGRCNGNNYI